MSSARTVSQASPRPTPETDFHAWIVDQVENLRARRFDLVDAEAVAEELSDVGKSEVRELKSALIIVLQHMLKWDVEPEKRSMSWIASIREHRDRIDESLRENPSFKRRLQTLSHEVYRVAVYRASGETGLDESAFPSELPYDREAIMTREHRL